MVGTIIYIGLIGLLLFFLFVLIMHLVKSDLFALVLIFTSTFSLGIFLLLDLPGMAVKAMTYFLIIVLFLRVFISRTINKIGFKTFGLLPMLLLFVASLLSALLNGTSLLEFMLFGEIVFVYYLFFLAVINMDLSEQTLKKVNRYLIALFLIQIPAALIKLVILQDLVEGRGIGTIEIQSGNLSVIMPMFATGFLLAFYFKNRKILYLVLILGFLAFALINNKRAMMFFLLVLFVAVQFIYFFVQGQSRQLAKNLIVVLVLSVVAFYSVVRINPTLNPDNKIGGRFDLQYALSYTEDYTSSKSFQEMRRKDAPKHFYSLLHGEGLAYLMLGMGPGQIAESRFLNHGINPILQKYGIRYGARTAFLWFLIQVGLLGVLAIIFFQFDLGRQVLRKYRKSPNVQYKILAVGFLAAVFTFFIDFFLYSPSVIKSGALVISHFYVAGILLNKYDREYDLL